jgi:hypothetical protein
MRILLLLSLLLNISCGRDLISDVLFVEMVDTSDPRRSASQDPSLKRYINRYSYSHQEFIDVEAVTKLSSISIVFVENLNNDILGQCVEYSYNGRIHFREIEIDRNKWNDLNEFSRQTLINHELGHCHLGRDHDHSIDKDGNPLSIMHPSNIGWYYKGAEYEYDAELFTRNKDLIKGFYGNL